MLWSSAIFYVEFSHKRSLFESINWKENGHRQRDDKQKKANKWGFESRPGAPTQPAELASAWSRWFPPTNHFVLVLKANQSERIRQIWLYCRCWKDGCMRVLWHSPSLQQIVKCSENQRVVLVNNFDILLRANRWHLRQCFWGGECDGRMAEWHITD